MRVHRLGCVVAGLLIVTASIADTARRVEVDPQILAGYAGRYELAQGIEFDVAVVGGALTVQLTGQGRYPLDPESETSFAYRVVEARITFEKDDDGNVIGLTLHQGGTTQPARRIAGDSRSDSEPDAAARFEQLERRLLEASSVHVRASVTSTGVVRTSFVGHVLSRQDNRVSLAFAGEFDRNPINVILVSDGSEMAGGAPGSQFKLETPSALNEGLLLGFTRLGFLHNLAMLAGGAPPERTDGSIRDWVQVKNVGYGDSGDLAAGGTDVLSFEIVVGGSPSGTANLWIDPETGYPTMREQSVEFPGGTMHVIERYTYMTLGGLVADGAFVLPGAHDHPAVVEPPPGE